MSNTRAQREETREGQGRKKRVPLGTMRRRLDASHLIPPGKVGRWIADTPGRLQAAEAAGYVKVTDPDAHIGQGADNQRDGTSAVVRMRGGTQKDGKATMLYLMVIDQDLYETDQREKEMQLKNQEDAMKRGNAPDGGFGQDGRYVPAEGISIEQSR